MSRLATSAKGLSGQTGGIVLAISNRSSYSLHISSALTDVMRIFARLGTQPAQSWQSERGIEDLAENPNPNKKVVLIFPKLEKPQPSRVHYLPLSVLTIGTVAAHEGYDVTIIDSRIDEDYRNFIREIPEAPLCFGISCIIGYQLAEGIAIVKEIKKRFPDTPIVWGGWFPTIVTDDTVASLYADIVVKGQGEFTFIEVLDSIREEKPLSSVENIAFVKNGEVIHTPSRIPEDPSQYPSLNYDLLDLSRYNSIQSGSANLQTSRGCPYRCKFCCTPQIYSRKWNALEPERVLDELELLVSKYKISHVEFVDDNFLSSRKRAERILEGMIERGLNLTYTASVRINNLVKFDPELFDLIKRSGCAKLYASSESGTNKILGVIQKDITVEQIRQMAVLFKRYDLDARTTFMVGLPEETLEDLKSTFSLSMELLEIKEDLDIYFSFFLPIPGTDFFDDAKSKGLISVPQTLDEWATCVPVDQRQFWLFLPTSDKLSTEKRHLAKKVSFYFWFGHFPRFKKFIGLSKWLFPLKAIRKICAFRYDHDLYAFPIEWWLFRMVWSLKLSLSEPKDIE